MRKRDFSLRAPTGSQERSGKKKSARSVRNDGWVWEAFKKLRQERRRLVSGTRGCYKAVCLSPLRGLAGGQHAWRAGAEGCIGRGGIALCGWCLSLADVCQARGCVGDDAQPLCHTRHFLASGST